MVTFFLIMFAVVCVLLILIVMLQSSRASGMELFGSTQTIFGAQSGDILTKITTVLAVLFLAGSFGFAIYQSSQPSLVEQKIEEIRQTQQPAPESEPVQGTSNNMVQPQETPEAQDLPSE
ncbi:MAG: preprotein translocase subunit SecG [Spirochaetes bacterium]|nr:preprotein translocase subunit SecG [Spirochaetota bacterium]